MIRKTLSMCICFLMCANPVLSFSYPYVVGYHSLNNSTNTSLKTDESLLQDVSKLFTTEDDFNEIINYSTDRVTSSNSATVSYLIENDIIGEDLDVNAKDLLNSKSFKLFNYDDGSEVVKKSDFLMTLAKAVYGVQYSRPLVYYSKEASRLIDGKLEKLEVSNKYIPNGYQHLFNPDGYEDEKDTFVDFSKGDYYTYVSPNVYEMYFKTLVDKGIVPLEDFSNVQLVSDLTYMSKISNGIVPAPLWSNSLGFYDVSSKSNLNPTNGVKVFGDSVLGQFLSLDKEGNLNHKKLEWFFNEDLLVMDALKYIETILRTTEKDMTDLEAQIINYKYGHDYMQFLSDSDRKTVQFLIAKGVLNFEDSSEFKGLYKELTMDLFLKLIYRVHNPNARLDFSKVQLTDSDNYWLSNGFTKGTLSLKKSDDYPDTEVSVEKVSDVVANSLNEDNPNGRFLKSRPTVIAASFNTYVVTRTFYSNIEYYYKGYVINEKTKFPTEAGVKEIKAEKDSSGNKVITAKFEVNAISPEAAISIVDANTTTSKGNVYDLGTIPTFNKVDSKGNTVYYVSKDVLSSIGLPIKFIEDKYLMNSETGARALLMENNKMAIVGNEVIKNSQNMVFNINGEVHYNFNIISKLLTDAHIDRLDPGSAYITDVKKSDRAVRVQSSHMLNEEVDVAYVNSFDVLYQNSSARKPFNFLNITQSNALSNFLMLDIGEDLGLDYSCYMVVEFKYVINKSLRNVVSSFDVNRFLNGTVSMEDVYDWMYVPPTDSDTLNSWWKENVSFNNALLNYAFGTSGSNYMKSGYLVPQISLLVNSSDDLTSAQINEFFLNKMQLPTSVASVSYEGKNFLESFFNYNSINYPSTSSTLTLLKNSRTLNTYINNSDKKANYEDYGSFVISKSKQIYKNIDSDSLMTLDGDSIKFKTREYQDPSFRVGSIYTLSGVDSADYLCTLISHGVVTMIRKDPLKVKYKTASNRQGYLLMVEGVDKELLEYANEINSSITDPATTFENYRQLAVKPSDDMVEDDKIYYANGEFLYKEPNKGFRSLKHTNSKDLKLFNEKEILVYSHIRFNENALSPDADNVVDKEYNFPFLDMGNYSGFGITHQLIDSIVYSSSGYVSFADLPQGAKVTLGDVSFVKSGDSLVSSVITDGSISSEFMAVDLGDGGSGNDGVKAMVAKLFNSFDVSIVDKGIIRGNALLSSYVKQAQIAQLGSTDINNTLVRKNGKLYLLGRNGKFSSYESGMSFAAFSVAVKLEPTLQFRPIGSTDEYVLVRSTNSNADGFLTKLPFRSETLSYTDNDLFYSNINKSLYAKSDYAEELFTKFKDLFANKKRKDVLGVIQYNVSWILFILTFSVIFVAYLKTTPLNHLVKEFAENDTGSIRFDFYAIITLGLITVDTEMTLVKSVLVSFTLFALRALINVI